MVMTVWKRMLMIQTFVSLYKDLMLYVYVKFFGDGSRWIGLIKGWEHYCLPSPLSEKTSVGLNW